MLCLVVEGDAIGARVVKLLDVMLGVSYHYVAVEVGVREFLAEGLHDRRADC